MSRKSLVCNDLQVGATGRQLNFFARVRRPSSRMSGGSSSSTSSDPDPHIRVPRRRVVKPAGRAFAPDYFLDQGS